MESQHKTNVFNDEGRILQVEYAIKNVSKAGTIIGVVCVDGVLLLGIRKGLLSPTKEKIYRLNKNVYAAICGLFSDCLRIVGHARKCSENFLEDYGVDCKIEPLAKMVGKAKQIFTQRGGMRPFGVAMVYAADGLLFSTDPSGSVIRWDAVCFGEHDEAINREFRKVFSQKCTLQNATKQIFKILGDLRELSVDECGRFELLYHMGEDCFFVDDENVLELIKEAKANKAAL